MTSTDDLDNSVSLQVQFCRCCWIYYQQLSGCFIQFILSLQIQHPSPPYGASYISSQCYKIFFYHIDLQVVKMRYRLNSEMFELQIGEPPLGAVPDKITYMENMILFTIQNTFACAGILQEGDETEGIYCRASYIYLYSLWFNGLFRQPENENDQHWLLISW